MARGNPSPDPPHNDGVLVWRGGEDVFLCSIPNPCRSMSERNDRDNRHTERLIPQRVSKEAGEGDPMAQRQVIPPDQQQFGRAPREVGGKGAFTKAAFKLISLTVESNSQIKMKTGSVIARVCAFWCPLSRAAASTERTSAARNEHPSPNEPLYPVRGDSNTV